MAEFAQRMRKAPYVIGIHIRSKMGDLAESEPALLEPWDVDAFADCYINWARTHERGSIAHDDHAVAPDDWAQHVVFLAADVMPVRDRIRRKLVDSGLISSDRFLSFSTVARETHTGVGGGNDQLLRLTYAEFFLFELTDSALLTAWSSFGEAATDRAGMRESYRHYINHSGCQSEPRGCIEPHVPQICIFNPSHDHDHHDAQFDDHGNPIEALRRIKLLEEQLAARAAELKAKQPPPVAAPDASAQPDNSSRKEL